jgi:hypothetical protein
MKLQPFNLELWLHLGKPDCVWTRNGYKVIDLIYYPDVDRPRKTPFCSPHNSLCLSGKVKFAEDIFLSTWTRDGYFSEYVLDIHHLRTNELFNKFDLILHLDNKSKGLIK